MNDLQKISNVLTEFTTRHHKITGNMMQVFLYLAQRTDEVITTRDLPGALGLPQTTINRLIRTMADRSYARENGFKWLKQHIDPMDERQRIVELTPKGRELANILREIMKDA